MKVLIVVDVQNDFTTGALGSERAQAAIPAIKDKIAKYLLRGDKVIYTQDTHKDNYMNTCEGMQLPVMHCIEGTWGWQIVDGVYADGCPILQKPSFGIPEFGELIAEWYHDEVITEIELIGFCTDICVLSNALILKTDTASWKPIVNISVDAECCAGATPETHRSALKVMKMCQIYVKGNTSGGTFI